MRNMRLVRQGWSKVLPGENEQDQDKLGLEGGKGLPSESRETISK